MASDECAGSVTRIDGDAGTRVGVRFIAGFFSRGIGRTSFGGFGIG
jgi:hypothetical protein